MTHAGLRSYHTQAQGWRNRASEPLLPFVWRSDKKIRLRWKLNRAES
jgi:hypothetical protein